MKPFWFFSRNEVKCYQSRTHLGLHVLPQVGIVLALELCRLGHLRLLRGRPLRRRRHLSPLLVLGLRRLPRPHEPHLGHYYSVSTGCPIFSWIGLG